MPTTCDIDIDHIVHKVPFSLKYGAMYGHMPSTSKIGRKKGPLLFILPYHVLNGT